ncbi:1-(5-phosphoribosyl)-5-[(5-phosphoribosylamino)methylideneamino]imidazole-4-carboxamide isomerase [Vulcanibacillus modesticaldus]|uniref:1-(5-phosphoribosyl)-5-[(5-phosphoribosylamino)methylideneamino] imidazole-4-carboxamide isomerase n=1 Tax=Vulcanibacillus modesticaldus TaxID=337097 RepID=A0A1D2YV31_9BACI|nr:1-(5-phosphoribosyl)-5-[(5-phosphoribosylamino)methylideneamino]imidazole-4-carboxamide isomerase [Vulcanibacillus modesticaldus]OEF99560.1 1-(5-phosphoribosyl)-5-[(5-phosphoribosylamino)methylideneamino]imidazole-4-carboxamide isomerase [Vulcanibacillus modesticaldus]
MIIFPAIDIKENKCVRLSQGDFDRVKIYADDPLAMAQKWKEQGAEYIHLVDLDGARTEEIVNKQTIEKIVNNIGLPIQIGGGIRDEKRVQELLNLGVDRVILGTIAVENKELLKSLVSKYQEKIVVSIDANDGKVAIRGWEVVSDINSIDFCLELEAMGVKTIVYTDIARDGMLMGPNFAIYKKLAEMTSLNIIASGGISSLEDLKKLKQMNIYGAIVGKALYDNRIDLQEALKCLQEE